jgi:predicted transposase YbfD/YdcC
MELQLVETPAEIERFDQLVRQHHYLKNATLVGQHLRYVATYQGRWLALASWSAAALHLKERDRFIGWSHEQCRRRRGLLANNTRLLALPDCHYPNLMSRFMKMMLGGLSEDWRERWGHPLALVETFVDPQYHRGTAYKVSGWRELGSTAGWKRDARDFYLKHDTPKQIWVRELAKKACRKLRAPRLAPEWESVEALVAPHCTETVGEIRALMDRLKGELKEFRRAQALAYPVVGMVGLILMAMATGVRQGTDDLAKYADTLSQSQLRALGFRRNRWTRSYRAPKKTSFFRVLAGVDGPRLQQLLLSWQGHLLGPSQDELIVIDGKKLRHGGVEMVNATDGAGRFLGGVITQRKSNEIPAARQLLRKLDLKAKTVLSDALHTNAENARIILYERGGEYMFTVKLNQPTLHETLEKLFEEVPAGPKPAPGSQSLQREHNCKRLEIRWLQSVEVTPAQVGFPGARLAARLETRVKRKGKWSREIVYLLSSLGREELQAREMLRLKRNYWVIESRLHHALDVTLQEDLSRVRTPKVALVLGTIRRVVVSLANAARDRARRLNPKTKYNTKSFRQHFLSASGGRQRLHALLFAKKPALFALAV